MSRGGRFIIVPGRIVARETEVADVFEVVNGGWEAEICGDELVVAATGQRVAGGASVVFVDGDEAEELALLIGGVPHSKVVEVATEYVRKKGERQR